jgi:type III pantothenate kinase
MTALLLDVGNTRVKWAMVDGGRWLARGAAPVAALPACRRIWQRYAPFAACHGVNVAGEAAAAAVAATGLAVRWQHAAAHACGVVNRYHDPTRLGADRWAALVAARARSRVACLVVSAGTALTADALTAGGEFLGGVIVPGLATMRWALAQRTAAAGADVAAVMDFPCDTAAGVATGSMLAAAGAIDRMRARLADYAGSTPPVLLTGGDAGRLAPHLTGAVAVVPDLVLEGVALLAGVTTCA